MGSPAEQLTERYTYADYRTWEEDKRWELIQGVPYCQAAPSTEHQRLVTRLLAQFEIYLEGKSCEVLPAPIDVILADKSQQQEEINTVVQPDLIICCDPSKITRRACEGAPDLIIEVLSPSTFKRDLNDKFQLYEKVGVKEYWVVSPGETSVIVYELDKAGRFQETGIYFLPETNSVPVSIFENFQIDLNRIFR